MRKVPRRKKKAEIFLTNKVKEREKEGKEKRKNLQKSLQLSCGTLENSSTITRPVDLPKWTCGLSDTKTYAVYCSWYVSGATWKRRWDSLCLLDTRQDIFPSPPCGKNSCPLKPFSQNPHSLPIQGLSQGLGGHRGEQHHPVEGIWGLKHHRSCPGVACLKSAMRRKQTCIAWSWDPFVSTVSPARLTQIRGVEQNCPSRPPLLRFHPALSIWRFTLIRSLKPRWCISLSQITVPPSPKTEWILTVSQQEMLEGHLSTQPIPPRRCSPTYIWMGQSCVHSIPFPVSAFKDNKKNKVTSLSDS